jgi:hypothetical protein
VQVVAVEVPDYLTILLPLDALVSQIGVDSKVLRLQESEAFSAESAFLFCQIPSTCSLGFGTL